MKTKILAILSAAFLACLPVRAQVPTILFNAQWTGTSGGVQSGSTFNVLSGSTLNVASGSTMQFGGATTNQLLYSTNSSGVLAPLTLGTGLSITTGTLNVAPSSTTFANPTSTIGLSTVNGVLTTAMRSDGAPALSQAIQPTWTAQHQWQISNTASSGVSTDISLKPTLNQTSTAGYVDLFVNRTETAIGSGHQYFEEFQVGGTDKWVIDRTGSVITGIWTGSVIGATKGGAGTVTGILKADGSGNVSAASSITDYTPGVMTNNGDLIYFNGASSARIAIGTSGQILEVVGGVPVWATGAVGGNVFSSGSITTGFTAEWTSATTIGAVANTGTGNYVKSASPTLTGTITAAIMNMSGALSVGGTAATGVLTSTNSTASLNGPSVAAFVATNLIDGGVTQMDVGLPGTTDKAARFGVILGSSGASYADTVAVIYLFGEAQSHGFKVDKSGNTRTFGTSSAAAYFNASTTTISASAIDWATSNQFKKTLAASTTFTFSNAVDGQPITVALTNTASNWTVTWPTVSWVSGVAPTQTIGAHTDVYSFIDIGGTIYGAVIQNY